MIRGLSAGFLALTIGGAAAAQQPDRTRPPRLAAPRELALPATRTATLSNGVRLYVARMPEVPVVQLVLSVEGGGRLDGDRAGLAAFTAGMLDEGADTLDAFAIAAQAEYLGASLSASADWDASRVALKVPRRSLGPALRLMADVAVRPTFASAEVARQRDLRLAEIVQERDIPEAVGSLAFAGVVYPEGHPYHRALGGDSASVARFDSAAVRAFYRMTFRPERATMIVTGDITLAEARRAVEREFGGWRGEGIDTAPPRAGSESAPIRPAAVYLVDKPGAAQSVIRIGSPGVDRLSPDYWALTVMNTILGGSFSARLNSTLRETKGYTYGAFSAFDFRPLPGPFLAAASVRTEVTDSSLAEFMRELRAIREQPVDSVELARAKAYITLALPAQFETSTQMASRIGDLLTFGLPLDYYGGYAGRIRAVTREDVQRVARAYIRPDSLSVVVVGDLAKVRPAIEALRLGQATVIPAP